MPTKLPRVMVSIRDEGIAPTIGASELNGLTIASVLKRYAALVEQGARDAARTLARDEWNAIADANNGALELYEYVDGPDRLSPLLVIWSNVQDCEGLGEKWDANQTALVKKLRALPYSCGEAIMVAARWFWANCQHIDHTADAWWEPEFRRKWAAEHAPEPEPEPKPKKK